MVKRYITERSLVLFTLSPSSNILQNYSTVSQPDIDIDTVKTQNKSLIVVLQAYPIPSCSPHLFVKPWEPLSWSPSL